jgi:hypothetical protein
MAADRRRDDFLKTLFLRLRIPALVALLALAGLACSLTDIFNSPPSPPSTSAPLPTAEPTAMTCQSAATSTQVGDILFNAQVTEHSQPAIRITTLYINSSQIVEFVRPDQFRWRTEGSGAWEEIIYVGGSTYTSSPNQAWQSVPGLDPALGEMMQPYIDPPKPLSEVDITAQLNKMGITDVKFEGHLVGLVPDFFGTCVYEIIVKSGDRIIHSEKTWISPADGLRYKVEIKDENRTVTETRLFDYEGISISAP